MYREELRELIYQILYEDWMDEDDIDEAIEEAVAEVGGWAGLDNALLIGVQNGYSIDSQLNMIQQLIRAVDDRRAI